MTEANNPYECIGVHEHIFKAVESLVASGAFQGKKILDVGAGYQDKEKWCAAVGSKYWLGDLYKGLDVTTMDIRPECECMVTGDAENLYELFPDAKFDVAFSFETLEHCLIPQNVISQIWLVLKPGGVLFISTPQAQPHHTPRHLWLFTEVGIRYLLLVNGFQVLKQVPLGGTPGREWSWLTIAQKVTPEDLEGEAKVSSELKSLESPG